MRRKIAVGTIGLLVLLAAAIVTWAQESAAQGAASTPSPSQAAGGAKQVGAGGPRRFAGGGPGQFGGPGMRGGMGARRMGWQRGGQRGFGERRMGWQRGGGRGFGARRMGGQQGGRRAFGGGAGLLRMAENPRVRQELGLTDEQVGRLHKIGVDAQKAAVQTRADLQLRGIELRELLRADNPNHDAIMSKIDEVNALQGKMAKQGVETMLSARSVLTPEQLKKIKTFMESRGAGAPGRGGMMGPRGGARRPAGRPGAPGGAPGGTTTHPSEPPVQ